jgi:branched-chain amino acid transport system ATP-binding protein
MTEPILKVDNIFTGYDGTPVIHDISLEINPGGLVAIVGANGAGKTTTMRTIAGLMDLTKGSVWFDGEEISKLPAHQILRRGISYVPEGRRLFSKLTVRENLALGAYTEKDKRKIEKRIEDLFELFPVLSSRSSQSAETLSGGEQQMLAIARGMMSEPKLLMLDEMSLGLMPALVEKMMETIVKVNQKGVTILLVEQMVQEAWKSLTGATFSKPVASFSPVYRMNSWIPRKCARPIWECKVVIVVQESKVCSQNQEFTFGSIDLIQSIEGGDIRSILVSDFIFPKSGYGSNPVQRGGAAAS